MVATATAAIFCAALWACEGTNGLSVSTGTIELSAAACRGEARFAICKSTAGYRKLDFWHHRDVVFRSDSNWMWDYQYYGCEPLHRIEKPSVTEFLALGFGAQCQGFLTPLGSHETWIFIMPLPFLAILFIPVILLARRVTIAIIQSLQIRTPRGFEVGAPSQRVA